MKKVFAIFAALSFVLAGCSQAKESEPTVTITQTVPAPEINSDDGVVSNNIKYINFVRSSGGYYAQVATESQLISLGESVCQGFRDGLSENQIVLALSRALVENNMDNDDGAQFGAALIVGAKRYLCSGGVF